MRARMIASAVLVVTTPAASARPGANGAKDWAEILRQDATAFRHAILDSHPGPVDRQNPGFNRLLTRSYATAVERARPGIGYREYHWAMLEFGNSFDDGHLGVAETGPPPVAWAFVWPGFATRLGEDGHHRVYVREENGTGPAVGTTLVGCDGRGAAAFAADRLGPLVGRWQLAATRIRTAPRLFLRSDNPWRTPARVCTFTDGGVRTRYRLAWRSLSAERRQTLLAQAVEQRFTTGIAVSRFGNDGAWIAMGSFNSDPASEPGRQLVALQQDVVARAADLRAAPRLVFDLRGNNGGSSGWIHQSAAALWGKAWVDAKTVRSTGVDYRVSDANIANYVDAQRRYTAGDPVMAAWANRIVAGLTAAKQRGEPMYRSREEDAPVTVPPPGPNPVTGRVFVLTDNVCGSACLDAVDLLTALGAVQVGQETSADTLYMDIREQALPSGAMRAWIPTKVYRGRARGNNVPARPSYAWTGSMADTAGIQGWIAGLPTG